jgi:hypothetical protein
MVNLSYPSDQNLRIGYYRIIHTILVMMQNNLFDWLSITFFQKILVSWIAITPKDETYKI